ncbi:MAG: NYN domain-containing protein [Patescibacteria group bacterium]|nr:NYN domain-containing protein [Patescibacteria group bacterium]
MQERVAIYIDGSNFYFKLKSLDSNLANLLKFDFNGLCKYLSKDRKIISKRYYVGVVREKLGDAKSQQLRKDQQRLFWHLNSAFQSFCIKKGRLQQNDGIFHEKGVDVQLAVDLVVGAYEDYYDTAILISSDTDLVPAIRKVREMGKKIEYIGFSHQPSFGMIKHADSVKLLGKDDLEPFEFKGTMI